MKVYRYRLWPSVDIYRLRNSYQSVTAGSGVSARSSASHKYANWRTISAGPREIDRRFHRADLKSVRPRPRSGWMRAIRGALGMSQQALGGRFGTLEQR
jgi:hypothetical protein